MIRPVTLLVLIVLLSAGKTVAQQPSLIIYNYYGEKGKDSHSTSENISISGSTVSYSVKYTGRRGPDQQKEEKSCTLTREQLEKINNTITEKHLNVTDSLIIQQEVSGTQVTAHVSITVTMAGKTTKTKCKGDPADLTGKPLYTNSLHLFRLVKNMVDICR